MQNRTKSEYHLICLITGESHGGFPNLEEARAYARSEGLRAWDIWHGNCRVEYHAEITQQHWLRDGARMPTRHPDSVMVVQHLRPRTEAADPLDVRRHANECEARARRARDPRIRDIFLEKARRYVTIACELERTYALCDELDEMRDAALRVSPALGTA